MRFFFIGLLFLSFFSSPGQNIDTSSNALETITVKAFEQGKKLKEVPAAVNFIDNRVLKNFGTSSVVHAVNTMPGVHLEERSPGSYRLNIRGSSLRSPFGVRNVKIYYNDIPITDPGGNTYFNSLGYYNFNSIEIVKGPGSSLYGAGTGGVMIVESVNSNEKEKMTAELTTGSYGLRNSYLSASLGADASMNQIGFQHQEAEGFRYHSVLKRNIVSWNGRYKPSSKTFLKTTVLFSDLFYETPGALVKAEFEANPRLSRPAGGGFPGAESAKAAIGEKTFLAGISYTGRYSETFSNTTVAYGMFTELKNPAIRNYGKNEEPHVGGRTSFSYNKALQTGHVNIVAGAELQQGFASVFVYKNRNGQPDSIQTLDEIRAKQSLAFLQFAYQYQGWELTASGSLNFLSIRFRRSVPTPLAEQKRNFDNEFAPRLALAKKWKAITVYSSISKGFSPPTTAELLPSGSDINLTLNAERGTNYDVGFRGSYGHFNFDVNAFIFSLRNTIVQRRDAGGGDFFTNAGQTKQTGVESLLAYSFITPAALVQQSKVWISQAYHHFLYKNFKQLAADFSGKRLPGTPQQTMSAGVDLLGKHGISGNLNYYYSDEIPLNDANTEYAKAYHLLSAKLGYQKKFGRWRSTLAIGADNLLNQTFSLGNDINAFGGRFYNAAAGRSFYLSLKVAFYGKEK